MRTLLEDINGNPNIGVYLFSTNSYLLAGEEVEKSKLEKISKILGVEAIKLSIGGTSLVGIFAIGNEKKVLFPNIITDLELKRFKEVLEEKNIELEVGVLNSNLTALRNNILLTKDVAIVSPEFNKKEIDQISKFFGVKVIKMPLGKTHVPGSLVIINDRKAAISNLLSEEEEKFLEEELNVETSRISVNMGNPFITSGIVVNKKGIVIGRNTGGAEAAIIEQALRI